MGSNRRDGRRSALLGPAILLGVITSLPLLGLLYLGKQLADFPFLPFDLFDWLVRVLPGGLLTLLIDMMVRVIRGLQLGPTSAVAKWIEQLTALTVSVLIAAAVVLAIVVVIRRTAWLGRRVGVVSGVALFAGALALEMDRGVGAAAVLWLAVLIVGWSTLLGGLLEERMPPGATEPALRRHRFTRRVFLTKIGGAAISLTLSAWALGRFLEGQLQSTGANVPLPPALPGQASVLPAFVASPVAPGTRPAVTANHDFYRIDIDLRPPVISGTAWKLEVRGMFDRPRDLTLSDLMLFPAVTQPLTLSCISNPVGGDLIGNAFWTGLRVRDLMADLGMRPEARMLYISAADGFCENVALADLLDERTLLVYGMNGTTLPVEHGYPLRILIPNRYGMKQPKWITSIHAVDQAPVGFWVERGWSKEARPHIVSVIDAVAREAASEGRVPLGGIAWAGDRRIAKVELQVDQGPWEEARVFPSIGPLTWAQWRYDWPLVGGTHYLRVRATDGMGALQVETPADPEPNGATGYHSVTVAI